MTSTNTFLGLQAGVGQVAINPNSDGAYLGANSSDVKVFAITASYTQVAKYSAHVQVVTAAAGVTSTLPANLPVGFTITVIQGGAGQVTFTTATGAVLVNHGGFTKTAALNAVTKLVVISNVDGASATYVLSGDAA